MKAQRIVSLVPSITESLYDLGLGNQVVGITDYCIHPAGELQGLPHLGGPKNPRIADILDLKPDLVLANQEENTPSTVTALRQANIEVWVSFPQTVRQALDLLWEPSYYFDHLPAIQYMKNLEHRLAIEQAKTSNRPKRRYFCPIWYDPGEHGNPWWMSFNQHTYCHDILELAGGKNVFATRQRRYPLAADLGLAKAQNAGERDTRYPRLSPQEVRLANAELILLPDEPFAFNESHKELAREQFFGTQAVNQDLIFTLDGSLITWHGTRLGKALQILPKFFEAL